MEQVYRPRRPKESPLWQCLSRHFDAFLEGYEGRYQSRYGFLRPIIPEVVNKFLDCGVLQRGFARVRCDHCKHECLLEFLRTTLDLPEGLPGIVMAIHTFGEYLDFHPHLHALVADGLFVRSGLFYPASAGPDVSLKPLEELFLVRVITFLVDKGLLPVERANLLRGWVRPRGSSIRPTRPPDSAISGRAPHPEMAAA